MDGFHFTFGNFGKELGRKLLAPQWKRGDTTFFANVGFVSADVGQGKGELVADCTSDYHHVLPHVDEDIL